MAGNPMFESTPHGYNVYDLMSGLQKFIRRSMEKEAMFCFLELEAHKLYSVAKNRLLTIVYEDCGIANESLLGSISGHVFRMDEFYKKKNGAWRLIASNIILSACRGKKSRIADQFVCYVCADIVNGYRINFDEHDFVFDMHTRKGKVMGRGAEHFYEHASKIVESELNTDYYQEEIDSSNIAEDKGFDVLEDYSKPDSELNIPQGDLFDK